MIMDSRQKILEELYRSVCACRACDLHTWRQQCVLPEGDLHAHVMMIAQAPGREENQSGRMFTGPSGKIFDRLLEGAGVKRQDLYLTNLIKCMLPKARRPSRSQWDACTPWLEQEIKILQPRIVVPLGFQALKFILIREKLPRPPKKEYRYLFGKYLPGKDFMIYPLRHPTALLFDPGKEEIMSRNYAELKKIVYPAQQPRERDH